MSLKKALLVLAGCLMTTTASFADGLTPPPGGGSGGGLSKSDVQALISVESARAITEETNLANSITSAGKSNSSPSVTAAGSSIAGATALTATSNTVISATAGQGVSLPTTIGQGRAAIVFNRSAVTINVYPTSSSDQIESYGAGVAFPLYPNTAAEFWRDSSTSWRIK